MYFFKSENKVLYKSAKLNIASAQVITDAPKKTECAAAANLFKNYDISDVSGDTFWTSGKGFFPTIKLADTGTTMGNAIYYCENTYGSGYPKGTYYIKWIDVKVNTDYTFAADYRVIKAGDGWFGLINGSEFLPSRIKGFTFAQRARPLSTFFSTAQTSNNFLQNFGKIAGRPDSHPSAPPKNASIGA